MFGRVYLNLKVYYFKDVNYLYVVSNTEYIFMVPYLSDKLGLLNVLLIHNKKIFFDV